MTRQEFRTTVKKLLMSLGYRADRKYLYKIIDNDYVIGFYLDVGYGKAYTFNCGMIFLPDNEIFPLTGYFEYRRQFLFPFDLNDPIDYSAYPDDRKMGRIVQTLPYELCTHEQLEFFFAQNYDLFMRPLEDKEYAYDLFRNKRGWKRMSHMPAQRVIKICNRVGLDTEEVFTYLGKSMPTTFK